jgi:putative copper export protein
MTIEAVTKALLYAAVLQTVGAATAFWVAAPHAMADMRPRLPVELSIGRVGLCASAAVVVALVLRAWAHTATAFGLAQSMTPGAVSTIVAESRWGRAWQMQMLAAVACVVVYGAYRAYMAYRAYGLARGPGRSLQVLAAFTSAALSFSLTRTGHAAGAPTRMALHTVHVLGAGTWLGTLTTLIAVRRTIDGALRRSVFRAFSRLALTGAAVLVTTGIVASWSYIGPFTNLWMTPYGRVLLVKVVLVAGVVICGYVNWRSIESGRSEPGRAAVVELSLAGLVVAVTGALTELEHP